MSEEVDRIIREAGGIPRVDPSKRQLVDGRPVPDDGSHTKTKANGQQESYVVLTDEERARGFVRPVRTKYVHVGCRPKHPTRPLTDQEAKDHDGQGYWCFEVYPPEMSPLVGKFWTQRELSSGCGAVTVMGRAIAETYARMPGFYSGTFCVACRNHFPVGASGEFVWDGTDERVGT